MAIKSIDDYPVVVAEGEVDHWKAPELEYKIDQLIFEGHKKIILDFSQLTYIDSGGIAVLFLQLQKLQPTNGELMIVTENKNILKILDLVKITEQKSFSLYSDIDEAKKQLKGSSY